VCYTAAFSIVILALGLLILSEAIFTGVRMNEEMMSNKMNLIALGAAVVLAVLTMTWTPAYGFNMSRIDNLSGDLGAGGNPDKDGSTAKSNSPGMNWGDTDPIEYSTTDNVDPNSSANVPEPATLLLLGFGLAGGAITRRLSKRST
jgi:hypothetical protein